MTKFTPTRFVRYIFLGLFILGVGLIISATTSAYAHAGGEPQIINGDADPFLVSVWSLPNPLVIGDVNFIAAVAEEKEINGYQEAVAILDAQVEFMLTAPDGFIIKAAGSQQNATNKLFYEAYFELPDAGEYDVTVTITRDGQSGSADFVASAARPPLNINWTLMGGIAVVLLAVAWFIWQSRTASQEEPQA